MCAEAVLEGVCQCLCKCEQVSVCVFFFTNMASAERLLSVGEGLNVSLRAWCVEGGGGRASFWQGRWV